MIRKPLVVSIAVLLVAASAAATGVDSINALLRQGRYQEALREIQKTHGIDSDDSRRLSSWIENGHKRALSRSDSDTIHREALDPYEGRGGAPVPKPKPDEPRESGGFHISLLAGFNGGWLVAMSAKHPGEGAESYHGPGEFPSDWIQQKWSQGYDVTRVAGDRDGWVVVVQNKVNLGRQKCFGPGQFPEGEIAGAMMEGYRITSVAGFNDEWVVVMSDGSGYGHQRFTKPTDFETKTDWIQSRWDAGYRITSLAGDSSKEGGGQFVIVMSEESGFEEQVYKGPHRLDADWIKEKWEEGYYMTAAAGFSKWVVVMSKGVEHGNQRYNQAKEFPKEWIKKNW
jgi:hypothetical protein